MKTLIKLTAIGLLSVALMSCSDIASSIEYRGSHATPSGPTGYSGGYRNYYNHLPYNRYNDYDCVPLLRYSYGNRYYNRRHVDRHRRHH